MNDLLSVRVSVMLSLVYERVAEPLPSLPLDLDVTGTLFEVGMSSFFSDKSLVLIFIWTDVIFAAGLVCCRKHLQIVSWVHRSDWGLDV